MAAYLTTHVTLLARVADGADPSAWHEFCERYGETIRGFAVRQGLQAADCDDVLQDVLLALTRALPGFRYDPAKGKFRSYLKTLVLHAIYRRTRQKDGAGPLEDIEATTRAADDDQAAEEAWELEWRQYHLRQAMKVITAEFNAADRAAFQAYAVEGREARAVAEDLGLSVDQVYQAKTRMLRRLSGLIRQQVEDEG